MSKTLLRIAFADDDQDDHLLFYKAVKSFYLSPVIDCFFTSDSLLNFYTKRGNPAPHIIFLDKNMPGNYNYECLARMKNNEALMSVPIIIYSTSSHPADVGKARQLGATDFITKPVKFSDTIGCLRNAIDNFVPHNIVSRSYIDQPQNQY
ncbi:MAG: response regulator [Chitinophagaceae bacterium]